MCDSNKPCRKVCKCLAERVPDTAADQTHPVCGRCPRQPSAHDLDKVAALTYEVLRLTELVASLLTTAPKCDGCNKSATRRYFHIAGQWSFACDDDKCMEEDFCTECGQVWWHTDSEACGAYKDGGEVCTSTTKEARITASSVRDVPHAAAIRGSGQTLNGSTGQ